MLLTFIFSILTATYSLNSTTTVELSGSAPASSTVLYERTASSGKKGQMTAGNSTRLELRGWDGCNIKSVELQMHSNISAGAGSLTMKVGIDTLWAILNQPFNNEVWAGEYSTEWVTVQQSMNTIVGEDECIEINISATENSLYINSYTIYYEPASPQTYLVHFETGLDTCPHLIKQSMPGQEVILPMWKDTACWYFLGWTETEVLENQLITSVLPAGSTYIPRKNTTLWAVYSEIKENAPILDYVSGKYVLTMYNEATAILGGGMALCGSVGELGVPVSLVQMTKNNAGIFCLETTPTDDMLYDLVFNEDNTLTITHVNTNKTIGYKGNKLATIETPWQYSVLDDGSLSIYNQQGNYSYALYIGAQDNIMSAYAQRINLDNWQTNAFWLFPVVEVQYTSWPFGKFDALPIITLPESLDEVVYHFGIHELHIRDGKKIIYIK
jgi:hypothetical protein